MTSTNTPPPRPPLTRFLVPLLALVFLLPIALSKGFSEADEINHFLIAREALYTWSARLDIWGRPGCSLFFAPVTPLGLAGARLLAAVVTLLVCAGTVRLGRALLPLPENPTFFERHRDFFLFLVPFAFPAFLLFSASVMTEMLLTLAWTWAAVALVSRRPLLASLLLGLGGLARPEGFFAIAAWPLLITGCHALARRTGTGRDRPIDPSNPIPILPRRSPRQEFNLEVAGSHALWGGDPTGRAAKIPDTLKVLVSTLLAGLPVLLWYLAGLAVYHSAYWPKEHWPWQVHSQYGASLYRFSVALNGFMPQPWVWSLPILGAVVCGLQRRFVALAVLSIPCIALILLHGILGTYGLFGSLPMPRYFISIAPFLAILIVHALGFAARFLSGLAISFFTLAVLAVAILVPFQQHQLPIPMPPDGAQIDAAVDNLSKLLPPNQWADHVIAFHPYARYRLGITLQTDVFNHSMDRAYLANAPAGTIVISDDQLCLHEGHAQAPDFLDWGYVLDPALQDRIDNACPYPTSVHVFVWIKRSPAAATLPSP